MLSGSAIGVENNGEVLFEQATFQLNEGDRAGLTGRNGAGKSTLLKIIAAERKADHGSLAIQPGIKIAYLPQEIQRKTDLSVMQEAMTAFSEVRDLEIREEQITSQLLTEQEEQVIMDLSVELHHIHERLNLLADNREKITEEILTGLGFTREQFDLPVTTFSGGWRMRIELARLLLQKPDLLLLDEPTNHLDIEAIRWLEDFLENFRGAIVLVSHDKIFLDKITTHTWEVTPKKLYIFKGNYTRFKNWKAEVIEQQKAEKKNQEKYVEHTKELINKFRAKKNKAAFAQSLITKLEKLEAVEVDEEFNTNLSFRFPPAPASGKLVLEADGIGKKYGDRQIFDDVTFTMARGEKIALVGKNGQGKTTFTKILTGEIEFDGKLRFGHNVKVGYFAQDQHLRLDPKKTVYETVDDIATGDIRTRLRDLLGVFLFSGDDINKRVGVLSGGEKSRLALCAMMLEPVNLLILDEPTHHLDMQSTDMLKRALEVFDGTLIIVSHNRDFLTGLTEMVFEFRDGRVRQLHGDITEYLKVRDDEVEVEKGKARQQEKPVKVKEVVETKPRQDNRDEKKLRSRIEKLEQEITRLETSVAEIEQQMADPAVFQQQPEVLKKYQEVKSELDGKMEEWEDLSSRL